MEKRLLDNYPDVITPTEAKEILRIGKNKIYELLNSSEIPSFRFGRKIFIYKKSLIEYLEQDKIK